MLRMRHHGHNQAPRKVLRVLTTKYLVETNSSLIPFKNFKNMFGAHTKVVLT